MRSRSFFDRGVLVSDWYHFTRIDDFKILKVSYFNHNGVFNVMTLHISRRQFCEKRSVKATRRLFRHYFNQKHLSAIPDRKTIELNFEMNQELEINRIVDEKKITWVCLDGWVAVNNCEKCKGIAVTETTSICLAALVCFGYGVWIVDGHHFQNNIFNA